MSFLIHKKWGFIPELIHTSSFYNYGIFFGPLDIDKLNTIYYQLVEETTPFDYPKWEEKYNTHFNNAINDNLLNKIIHRNDIDIDSFTRFKIYHYYCLYLGSQALIRYLLDDIVSGNYFVWFLKFIPYLEVKQLNNNPWSDLDPLDDPNVDWKFSWKDFYPRSLCTILIGLKLEYKFID